MAHVGFCHVWFAIAGWVVRRNRHRNWLVTFSRQGAYLHGTGVQFQDAGCKDFRIEFHPLALPDGEYTLRVEGSDAKGNGSALSPYEVSFVVLNETTITLSEAYPNPTDNDVFFKIVVSGNAPPDFLELRVLGVNGQLQSILTDVDFPALQIGSNELNWNIHTRHGNALPNGIYIYQLTVGASDKVVQRTGKLVVMK